MEGPDLDPVAKQKAIDFADGIIAEILSRNRGDKAAIVGRLKSRLAETETGNPFRTDGKGNEDAGAKRIRRERYSAALESVASGKNFGLYVGDRPTRDDPALKEAYNAYGIVDEIFGNPEYGGKEKMARLRHHITETDTNLDEVRNSNKRAYWPYLDIRNEIYRRALRELIGDVTPKKPEDAAPQPQRKHRQAIFYIDNFGLGITGRGNDLQEGSVEEYAAKWNLKLKERLEKAFEGSSDVRVEFLPETQYGDYDNYNAVFAQLQKKRIKDTDIFLVGDGSTSNEAVLNIPAQRMAKKFKLDGVRVSFINSSPGRYPELGNYEKLVNGTGGEFYDYGKEIERAFQKDKADSSAAQMESMIEELVRSLKEIRG